MKNVFFISFVLLIVAISLDSCVSPKEITYFQDNGRDTTIESTQSYITVFRPGDIVTIIVSASDFEAVKPFNMPVASFGVANGRASGQQRLLDYLIDINGNIEFPVLGRIKLGGLNRLQASKVLLNKLRDYIKNPIINIRLTNFKITVLGEVKSPGSYVVANERITLPEALGRAGDLTIDGKRSNVLVIREINGIKKKYRIDLTKNDLFSSPVYFLAQNDVIYVETKKAKVRDSSFGKSLSVTFSAISAVLSIVLIYDRIFK